MGRVHPRPRAAGGEGDRARGEDRASSSRSPQLWADKKQKLDRAAKAYEKVLELEADNLQAAEALIPIYTPANNAKALANAIEVKLASRAGPVAKLELYREVAALYEGKVKDPQKAFDRYLAAFELVARRRADERRTSSAPRRRPAAWDEVVAAYRRGDRVGGRRAATATLGVTLRLRLGRVLVDEAAATSTRRSTRTAPSTRPTARTPRRIAALERLYRQTSRFADLLGIYEKKRELVDDPDEKKAINYEIAKLYENEIKDVDRGDRDLRRRSSRTSRATRSALAALDVLYGRLGRWEPYVDVLRRRIELDVGEARAHRSQVPPRPDAREAPRRPGGRARELPRDPLPRRAARRRARRARGACSQTRSSAPRPRPSSRTSTRSAATGRSSSARSRS